MKSDFDKAYEERKQTTKKKQKEKDQPLKPNHHSVLNIYTKINEQARLGVETYVSNPFLPAEGVPLFVGVKRRS